MSLLLLSKIELQHLHDLLHKENQELQNEKVTGDRYAVVAYSLNRLHDNKQLLRKIEYRLYR